jgi:MFS family permease
VAESIGSLAPLLLVGLQLTHGVAIGGAWSGMALSLTETAPPRRRGLIGGFVQGGVACGSILANIAVFAVGGAFSATVFGDWGWRLPFLAGGVLFLAVAIIGIRRQHPNQEALDAPVDRRGPISAVLRRPGLLILGAGLLFAANAAFYVTIIGTVEYGVTDLKLARSDLMTGALIAAVVGVLSSLGGGALADKIGRRPVVIMGAIASGLWAFPFFWLVNTGALELIAFAMVVSAFAAALGYGAVAAYLTELYPYRSRYTGTALAYHLGAAVAGGAAQVAVLELPTYVESGVSWFLLLSAVLTVACALGLPETRPRSEPFAKHRHSYNGSPA